MAKQPEQNLSSESGGTLTVSGLDLETTIFSSSGRGRSFFLTFLFIELIERDFRFQTWSLEMTRRTACSLTSRTHSRTGAVPTAGFALIEVDLDAAARAFVALTISVTFFAN